MVVLLIVEIFDIVSFEVGIIGVLVIVNGNLFVIVFVEVGVYLLFLMGDSFFRGIV